jgi:hypothetical protein
MQSVFERYLERMEQTSTPEIARVEQSRSSAASSALHLGRRRRTSRPSAPDEPLNSNNTARLLGGAGMFSGIIIAMRIITIPPTPNQSFKRTCQGLRPCPAA